MSDSPAAAQQRQRDDDSPAEDASMRMGCISTLSTQCGKRQGKRTLQPAQRPEARERSEMMDLRRPPRGLAPLVPRRRARARAKPSTHLVLAHHERHML